MKKTLSSKIWPVNIVGLKTLLRLRSKIINLKLLMRACVRVQGWGCAIGVIFTGYIRGCI